MPRRNDIPKGDPYWKEQYKKQKARGETEDQLERQKARRKYDKAGIDRTGKDIDHVKPLRSGGSSASGNLRLRNPSANQADNGHNKRKARKTKN